MPGTLYKTSCYATIDRCVLKKEEVLSARLCPFTRALLWWYMIMMIYVDVCELRTCILYGFYLFTNPLFSNVVSQKYFIVVRWAGWN